MQAYVELARAEFRRYSTYRMAIVAGVLTQTVFGYIRLGIFLGAVASAGGMLAGYDAQEAASYVWIGQAILASVGLMGWVEIADRVKSGEIAVDLGRPVDLQLSWWVRDLGRASLPAADPRLAAAGHRCPHHRHRPAAVLDGLPAGAVQPGAGRIDQFRAALPGQPDRLLDNDMRGFIGLYIVLASFLAGLFVPIDVLPSWLRALAYATPFPSILQFPIDVLSGRSSGLAAVRDHRHPAGLVGRRARSPAGWSPPGRPASWWCRVAELSVLTSYRVLLASRVRSQLVYRSSFWLTVLTSVTVGVVEFAEIYAILHNVPSLGGLDLRQAALVFALANIGFSLADLVFGQLDALPSYLRMGRLEALHGAPDADHDAAGGRRLPAAAAGPGRRRGADLARWPWRSLDLGYSPKIIYLLLVTPIVGGAIYGALFALAGGIQFFVIEGSEITNSFVYGGGYAGQVPGSVHLLPVRVLFTFVVPATLTAYLPALLILGLPGPALLPAWLGWLAPLFAGWIWLLAWLVWRAGVRHFTGAGG